MWPEFLQMFFLSPLLWEFQIPTDHGAGLVLPIPAGSLFPLGAPFAMSVSLQLPVAHASLPLQILLFSPLGVSLSGSSFVSMSLCVSVSLLDSPDAWTVAAVTASVSCAPALASCQFRIRFEWLCALLHMDPVFLLFAHLVIGTESHTLHFTLLVADIFVFL